MMRHPLFGATTALAAAALILTAGGAAGDTLGYYRFEPGGFLSDSSGSGRNLTNTAGHLSQPLPFGFPNPVPLTGAANTSAVDSVASSPGTLSALDDDAWTSNSMTVEAFIQPLGLGTATSTVVGQWDSSNSNLSWLLGIRPDGSVRAGFSSNGSSSALRDAFVGELQGGKSYYIATSYQVGPDTNPSGASVYGTMYVRNLTDGGPLKASKFVVMSTAFTSLFNASAAMTIGETANETSPFDGSIDEVRVSNSVLSANQLLAYSGAISVEYDPFVTVRLADPLVDGTITSLTVDLGTEQTTYRTSDLSSAVLTQFGGAGSIADMVMPASATGGPASGTRANLLGDLSVDTGFINLSDWAVAFGDNIENRAGPDIVLLDWGAVGNTDTVDITIGGVTLSGQALDAFSIQHNLSGRRYRTASTSLTSVAQLEAAAFGGTTPTTSASNNTLLIDLSDFGFAEGASLSAGAEVVFSNGVEIDPVAIFGLLTPSAALEGDFNSDGLVNAADYTLWRDNLNGDESLLNGGGDGNGVIDQGDYTLWKQNYGATSAPATAAVPEPASAAVLLSALLGLTCGARRRR